MQAPSASRRALNLVPRKGRAETKRFEQPAVKIFMNILSRPLAKNFSKEARGECVIDEVIARLFSKIGVKE